MANPYSLEDKVAFATGVAVFQASSVANCVRGVTLPVDGGWLAR